MSEKLQGASRIKGARRPNTIRNREEKKEPKLGLLTEKHRRMVSFRMRIELIDLLEELLKKYRTELYHRISKTDILEAAIVHASQMSTEDFIKMCADYGTKKEL